MHIFAVLLTLTETAFARGIYRPQSLDRRDSLYDQTTLESTCRWTNCGEPCPPNFVAIPRGDSKTEKMWDHTHCIVRTGLQTFCCPDTPGNPTCNWRGHHNSGHCTPGCSEGEWEVGTLKLGCKTKHQSACCSSSLAVEAYSQCKWVGEAPHCSLPGHRPGCPDDYPEFIFSASSGYGGEQTCDSGRSQSMAHCSDNQCTTGSKSYCCQRKLKPMENCAWYTKETHLLNPDYCEPSCPNGHIKLGIQPGDCSLGEGAYCCAGPAAPAAPPPPDKSERVLHFELAVKRSVRACCASFPVCSPPSAM
jgi:chitinase